MKKNETHGRKFSFWYVLIATAFLLFIIASMTIANGKTGIWFVDWAMTNFAENQQINQELEFVNECLANAKKSAYAQREIIGELEDEIVIKNQQIQELKSSLAVTQRINWFGEIICKLIAVIGAHNHKQEKYIRYLEDELSNAQRTTTLYLSVPDGQIKVYIESTPHKEHPRANL